MNTRGLKQAIRMGHKVTRHEEFARCVMEKRDAKLLNLYLNSIPIVPKRINIGCGDYPKSPALVRTLLAHRLDPNKADWLGKTFLHACAENGDRDIAAVFLDAGADINARDIEFNETPLAAAVRAWCRETNPNQAKRRRQMVEFLLNRGAASNLPGDKPWATPLIYANRWRRPDIVELLKRHGTGI
jgi:ankyrin repeat protein